MCEFCEMIVVIRLFAWLKGAKSGLNAGFWSWKRGFFDMSLRFSSVFQAVATGENGDIGWLSGESAV